MIKVLAVDVDGTLLRSDYSTSRRCRRAVARAQRRGVVVVVATGRRPATAGLFAREIGAGAAPLISLDGALVLDGQGQPLATIALGGKTVQTAVQAARDEGVAIRVNTLSGSYVIGRALPRRMLRRAFRRRIHSLNGIRHLLWEARLPSRPISALSDLGGEAVYKLIFSGPHEERLRARLEHELRGDACFTMPQGQGSEIVAPGVSKGFGLRVLAGHLGVGLQQMMAVGDNFNDVPMLRLAGRPVLMGNAPADLQLDVPRTLCADQDGLALAIEAALDA